MDNDVIRETTPDPINRKAPGWLNIILFFVPAAVALLFPEPFAIFITANVIFSLFTAYRLMSLTSLKKGPLIFASIAYGAIVFVCNYFLGIFLMIVHAAHHQ